MTIYNSKRMSYRFIISGGGTGGHIFPALSIANALKEKYPRAEFLFVGAQGRMEMEKVPAAGYKIKGLKVRGFDRKNMFRNVKVLIDLAGSMFKARRIIKEFKPDIAIGVGGYASAPVLRAASALKIPTLIQEQNSYAGVTNKLLAQKAEKICVAYKEMEKFFPADKIVVTGNPVRQDLFKVAPKDPDAYVHFNLDPSKKTLLVVGGSLGARTINNSISPFLSEIADADIQLIWQTGKFYFENARKAFEDLKESRKLEHKNLSGILVTDFISRMDYAYAIADLVVSRAGASSISELCLLAKPVILVPSPNVAEDHQTKNALALVKEDAALLVKDAESVEKLVPLALITLADKPKLTLLSQNVVKLAEPNSAQRIAGEISNIIEPKYKKK